MQDRLSFISADGFRLSAVIEGPQEKSKGGIILAHGLQGNKDSSARYENGFHVELSRRLVLEGFTVLRFDFRGHGESEGEQTDVTLSGEVADLYAAIRYLRRLGLNKIGIIAASFAGGVAVVYAAVKDENVGAIVLVCPTLDYRPSLLESKPFWVDGDLSEEAALELKRNGFLPHRDFCMGPVLINEAKIIIPFEFMPRIRCPVLTIHGNRDSIVPYEMSQKYHKCNPDSELLTLDGADHGPSILWTPEHTRKAINATPDWFKRFLQTGRFQL